MAQGRHSRAGFQQAHRQSAALTHATEKEGRIMPAQQEQRTIATRKTGRGLDKIGKPCDRCQGRTH